MNVKYASYANIYVCLVLLLDFDFTKFAFIIVKVTKGANPQPMNVKSFKTFTPKKTSKWKHSVAKLTTLSECLLDFKKHANTYIFGERKMS